MGFDFEVESIEIRTIILGSTNLYLFSNLDGKKITENMKCNTQKQSLVWNYNCTMTTGSIEVDEHITDIVCPSDNYLCDEYAQTDLLYDGKKHYLTSDGEECYELRPMKPWLSFD